MTQPSSDHDLAGYAGVATRFGRELNIDPEFVFTTKQKAGTTAQVEIVSPLEGDNLPVAVQDQHTRAFDLFFEQDIGAVTTLTTNALYDSYHISVTTGHGLIAGNRFILVDTVAGRGTTAQVVSTAGANTINMDRPLDSAFAQASTTLQQVTREMDVNGSVTPQTFRVGGDLPASLDITRIMIQMTTTNPAAFIKFGDLTALTRGLLFRSITGQTSNYWNVKTNAELANLMYDVTAFEGAKAFDVNGIAGRMTYSGQAKHGVTIRLDPGDGLEMIVQDDLTDLLTFRIIAAGHFVDFG